LPSEGGVRRTHDEGGSHLIGKEVNKLKRGAAIEQHERGKKRSKRGKESLRAKKMNSNRRKGEERR